MYPLSLLPFSFDVLFLLFALPVFSLSTLSFRLLFNDLVSLCSFAVLNCKKGVLTM